MLHPVSAGFGTSREEPQSPFVLPLDEVDPSQNTMKPLEGSTLMTIETPSMRVDKVKMAGA